MNRLSQARVVAATTPRDQIAPGSPEDAYQAINSAKMLWSFRRRDVADWREVIDRWLVKPEAWNRIPEDSTPYRSPKRMIELELDTDYYQFKEFVRIVLGEAYAAKIDEPYQDRPGAPDENKNAHAITKNNGYARNDCISQSKRGNTNEYLRQRIADDHPDALEKIGKGRKYQSVFEAARNLGIVKDRKRMCIYEDDPTAAGRYLAKHVDAEWMLACYEAFIKSL